MIRNSSKLRKKDLVHMMRMHTGRRGSFLTNALLITAGTLVLGCTLLLLILHIRQGTAGVSDILQTAVGLTVAACAYFGAFRMETAMAVLFLRNPAYQTELHCDVSESGLHVSGCFDGKTAENFYPFTSMKYYAEQDDAVYICMMRENRGISVIALRDDGYTEGSRNELTALLAANHKAA